MKSKTKFLQAFNRCKGNPGAWHLFKQWVKLEIHGFLNESLVYFSETSHEEGKAVFTFSLPAFVFLLLREPKKTKACFSKLETSHPTLLFNYRCQHRELINLQCSTHAADVVWDLTGILLWSRVLLTVHPSRGFLPTYLQPPGGSQLLMLVT